jgi:hypothetical protein
MTFTGYYKTRSVMKCRHQKELNVSNNIIFFVGHRSWGLGFYRVSYSMKHIICIASTRDIRN